MKRILLISLIFLLSITTINAQDNETFLRRPDVNQFINKMVKEHGFERKQVVDTLKSANLQPKIIESMNKPYEKKSWDAYKALFLTPERVQNGVKFWKDNHEILQEAEKKFQVPAHLIVAILGVETLYGKRQGNYRVLDALTTLAFEYPKRSEFFMKELKEFLLLSREQNIPATEYLGSYAGAIGKPQFMPSSYRFYAVDSSGKGSRDLINDNGDVIASVANYIKKHGWKLNDDVAQPVTLNGKSHKDLRTNTKKADYNYQQLVLAGVKPATDAALHNKKVGLIELETSQGQEYWMAFPNFYVITRYNASPQYALAVYLLAKQLRSQWESSKPSKLSTV